MRLARAGIGVGSEALYRRSLKKIIASNQNINKYQQAMRKGGAIGEIMSSYIAEMTSVATISQPSKSALWRMITIRNG